MSFYVWTSFQSVKDPSLTSTNVLKMTVNAQFSFGEVVKSVSVLKERIEDICQREIDQIAAAGKNSSVSYLDMSRLRFWIIIVYADSVTDLYFLQWKKTRLYFLLNQTQEMTFCKVSRQQ